MELHPCSQSSILRGILILFLAINGSEAAQPVQTSLVYMGSTGEEFSWLGSSDNSNTVEATCDSIVKDKLQMALNDVRGEWKVISFLGEDRIEEEPCVIGSFENIDKQIEVKSQESNISIKTNEATLYYTVEGGVKRSWPGSFDMLQNFTVTCNSVDKENLTIALNDGSISWKLTWKTLGTENFDEPIFGPFKTEYINNYKGDISMWKLNITVTRKAEATISYTDSSEKYLFWPGSFDKLSNMTVTCNIDNEKNFKTALTEKVNWKLSWTSNNTFEKIEEDIFDVTIISEVRNFGNISLDITFKRKVAAMIHYTTTQNLPKRKFSWPCSFDLLAKVIVTTEHFFMDTLANALEDKTATWNISWTTMWKIPGKTTITGHEKQSSVQIDISPVQFISKTVTIKYIPKVQLVNLEVNTKLYAVVIPENNCYYPSSLLTSRIRYIGSKLELKSLSNDLKNHEVWECKTRSQSSIIVSPMPEDIRKHRDKNKQPTDQFRLDVNIPPRVQFNCEECGSIEGVLLYAKNTIRFSNIPTEACIEFIKNRKGLVGKVFQGFPFKTESCLATFEMSEIASGTEQLETSDDPVIQTQPTDPKVLIINFSEYTFNNE